MRYIKEFELREDHSKYRENVCYHVDTPLIGMGGDTDVDDFVLMVMAFAKVHRDLGESKVHDDMVAELLECRSRIVGFGLSFDDISQRLFDSVM